MILNVAYAPVLPACLPSHPPLWPTLNAFLTRLWDSWWGSERYVGDSPPCNLAAREAS